MFLPLGHATRDKIVGQSVGEYWWISKVAEVQCFKWAWTRRKWFLFCLMYHVFYFQSFSYEKVKKNCAHERPSGHTHSFSTQHSPMSADRVLAAMQSTYYYFARSYTVLKLYILPFISELRCYRRRSYYSGTVCSFFIYECHSLATVSFSLALALKVN